MDQTKTSPNWQKFDELRGKMEAHQIFFKVFLDSMIKILSPKKGAIVDSTDYKIIIPTDEKIDGFSAPIQFIENGRLAQDVIQIPLEQVSSKIKNHDLITRFSPWGLRRPRYELRKEDSLAVPTEYQEIWDSLASLSDNGVLFADTTQSIMYSSNGKKFQDILNKKGYAITAYLEFPSGLYSQTLISPIFIAITKANNNKKLFIAEVDFSSDFEKIISNYSTKQDSGSLFEGTYVEVDTFTSITNYKVVQQIYNLQTEYKSYKQYELKDITLEINLTRDVFKEKENTIYIPKIGKSEPVSRIEDMQLKHQNYFQVVLCENVKSRYLETFFKSKMGLLALDSLIKGAVIGHRSKTDLEVMKLPIPELTIQELIATTSTKIEILKTSAVTFETELSVNPSSATAIQDELNNVLELLGKLSKEDEILAMIRSGESKTLEFKQTFTKDVDMNIKEREKKIRKASLKNIVAFLNSDGGTLLIGVKDNGVITGIEFDYYENDDKYLLNFKNQVKGRIGEDSYPFLNWEIITVKNTKIFRVDCQPASAPFYLDETEFFVRTNPSADKLEGKKLYNYLKERFPSN